MPTNQSEKRVKVTAQSLNGYKTAGKKIVMATCYDYSFARLLDAADIDVVLVGDSLGNVIQGRRTTLGVTLEDVIYHCSCVARGLKYAHLVGDMPFGGYQESREQAFRSAARLLSEGSCHAVKLEGGEPMAATVEFLTERGIPVMAHLGFTPQSVHKIGKAVQGAEEEAAEKIIRDAKRLEAAGAYSLVLEMVPATLAEKVTKALQIPTIGIGAGAGCDGQVLVLYDLLGLDDRFNPRFLKKYLNLSDTVVTALKTYGAEVREGIFPDEDHSF